jgi:CRISPR/Cas system-associated exonuclease Cas4 (RecB family)
MFPRGEAMSGAIAHIIKRVPPDPVPPKQWAFTSLNNFRACPRRWYLSRCHFDKFGGPLPSRLSRAGVEGDLLHAILEEYYDGRRDLADLFRPRKRLLELIEEWYRKNKSNHRCDAWRLKHQISVVEIVRQFWRAVETCGIVGDGRDVRPGIGTSDKRVGGTELWLQDAKSKLVGRCDLIRDGKLVDFKSGESHEWHRDQVLFYASLLFSQHECLVKAAEVLYLDSFERVFVAVPSNAEIATVLATYRALAAHADELIQREQYEARPVEAECKRCPVRMLCSVYCRNEAPKRIFTRLPEDGLVDFICEGGEILPEAAGVVIKVVSDLGIRCMFLPMPLVSEVGTDNLLKLRVMNAAIRSNEAGFVNVKLTSASEAFVVEGID